jgi:thiol-disulfide isomerase/thioredoxin
LTVLPFFALYTFLSIRIGNVYNFPVWIVGVIMSVVTYLLLITKVNVKKIVSLGLVISVIQYLFFYPNYFAYFSIKENPSRYSLLKSTLVDNNEFVKPINNYKGKVVLLDIWHSACLPCIKQFPEIQKLYDKYKSDTSVKIISLNFPLSKDKGIRPEYLTKNYSFEKLYFKDEKEYQKVPFEQVPLIVILDKNLNCRYAGDLNTKWNVFVGNINTTINKLKNEKL